MARQGRLFLVGYPQHVIARGNNRQVIFCCNEDYCFYLEKLKAGCLKYGVELHSYVLMTNHVHLLMTPLNRDSISRLMQMQGRCYVQHRPVRMVYLCRLFLSPKQSMMRH